MRGFGLVAILGALLLAAPAAADTELDDALSPSVDAPVSMLAFRGSLRGRLAMPFTLLERKRLALRFTPMIELANDPGTRAVVPWESWRGRASFEVEVRDVAKVGAARLGLRSHLFHESAHPTLTPDEAPEVSTYLLSNAVGVSADLDIPLGRGILRLTAVERLHVVTCNDGSDPCQSPTDGSVGFETGAELLWASGPWFAGGAASILFAHDRIRRENRISTRAGYAPTKKFQLFILALAGHDTGVRRSRSVTHLGAGIALQP